MKLKPFNITDLRDKNSNDKKEFLLKNNGNKKYFNIKIQMPGIGGKERTIKIYLDDDIKKIIDNFSKIFYIKQEVKEKLVKIIEDLKNNYLEKNNIIFNNEFK